MGFLDVSTGLRVNVRSVFSPTKLPLLMENVFVLNQWSYQILWVTANTVVFLGVCLVWQDLQTCVTNAKMTVQLFRMDFVIARQTNTSMEMDSVTLARWLDALPVPNTPTKSV